MIKANAFLVKEKLVYSDSSANVMECFVNYTECPKIMNVNLTLRYNIKLNFRKRIHKSKNPKLKNSDITNYYLEY